MQLAEVERIERDWPEVEEGPAKLLVSADGAMVPLLAGEWAEVKTVGVSEVGDKVELDGKSVVPTHTHSYFSRLSDAETFQRLSLGELTRRQVETAEPVAAVNDGAEWIQGFLDYHCPDAIRILDFAHAAERICQIGDVGLGEGHASLRAWQMRQLHQLKHQGPEGVLTALRTFAAEPLNVPVVAENLAYLEKRLKLMQYPSFQASGWPMGSGGVESGNTLVVEARLKGAGMHWARASVNAMLSLRNAVCNDRWEEAWQQSSAHIRRMGVLRRPVQPKRKPSIEGAVANPATTMLPAEAQAESAARLKPASIHPWRRFNDATKARLAQTATNART